MTDPRPSWLPEALEAVRERRARVAILGCGYVGLSLALGCARAGFRVLGIEPAEDRAKALAVGENPVPDVDIPEGELAQLADEGRLTFSTTLDTSADVFAICVPTPLRDGSPDLHFVEAAGEAIARVLRLGSLVILESTTYPGTTEELLRPLLEERSGLTAGESFALGHSPERIDPGNTDWGIHNTPKVVGGLNPASTELAAAFYGQFCERVVQVSSPRAAEMVKLLENTYRHVNIALANEMSMISRDLEVDPWEVIDAAASKPFGFTPFKPGPGVGGHCLLPGERIYLRDDKGVRILPVEEVWAEAATASTPEVLDGVDVTTPSRREVAALSDDLGDWNRLSALGRRRYADDAVEITTRDGRTLRVTADHPMLVHTDGGLATRPARDLRKGDLLPVWRGDHVWDALLNPRVDLLLDARWPEGRVGLRLTQGDWRPWTSGIREAVGERHRDEVIRSGRLPLETFLDLEGRGEIDVSHDDLVLWTGRGRSARSFPAVTELTPDIARLVGYYLAEGCITGRDAPRVVFAFHRNETEAKGDLKKLLGSLDLTFSEVEDPNWQTTQIKVSSRPFSVLLRDVLGCGSNSYDARVPPLLLGASAVHRRELLSGLLRGDGSVWTTSGSRTYEKDGRTYTHADTAAEVGYFSVNEGLSEDVEYLLLSLGYVPSLRRRPTQEGLQLRLHGTQDLAWLGELFCDSKRDRLRTYESERRHPTRASRSYSRNGELHLVPVERVERFPYEGYVYSLETRPSHTFAATHGIVVHNCIPVDPQYLAWRVRGRLGHQFRLLETAEDLNQRMPAYVVQRAGEILNEAGKAVRGAKVLVLGVAYKGGSADLRESPALRVLERLVRSGADITYHDPHVPAFELSERPLESVELTDERLRDADLVLVLTDHPGVDYEMVVREAEAVLDTRGITWGMDLPPDARVYRA